VLTGDKMKKVLIVDDEEDMIWSLQKNLSNKTLQVETLTASSGEEALETLKNTSVDLIVTDIKMPGMSGLDLLAEVQKDYPHLSVIVMTAYHFQECKKKALLKGGVSYIEKPFDINEMRKVIKRALKDKENGLQENPNKDIAELETLEIEIPETDGNGVEILTSEKPKDVQAVLSDEGSIEDNIVSTLLGFSEETELAEDDLWNDHVELELSDEGSIEDDIVDSLLGTSKAKRPKEDKSSSKQPEEKTIKETKQVEKQPEEKGTKETKQAEIQPEEKTTKETRQAETQPEEKSTKETKQVEIQPVDKNPTENKPVKEETEIKSSNENKQAKKGPEIRRFKENQKVIKGPEKNKSKEEEIMAELQELLTEFTNIPGVSTVCLVGRDGFLLDSVARAGVETEMIGAIASSGFGTSESMGNQLEKGVLSMTMIEYEEGPVMLSPVGGDAFLVVVADAESNLGMIRLKIKKHTPEIQTAAAI
jgi:CheY-like chemotaxis protein/predicted regulator of Ras-like GTPase activity (Roadblock/LC7/MglB family)